MFENLCSCQTRLSGLRCWEQLELTLVGKNCREHIVGANALKLHSIASNGAIEGGRVLMNRRDNAVSSRIPPTTVRSTGIRWWSEIGVAPRGLTSQLGTLLVEGVPIHCGFCKVRAIHEWPHMAMLTKCLDVGSALSFLKVLGRLAKHQKLRRKGCAVEHGIQISKTNINDQAGFLAPTCLERSISPIARSKSWLASTMAWSAVEAFAAEILVLMARLSVALT